MNAMVEVVEGEVAETVSVTAHAFLDHPSEPCLLIHVNGAWSFSTAGEAEELFDTLMDGDAIHQVIPWITLLREFNSWQLDELANAFEAARELHVEQQA